MRLTAYQNTDKSHVYDLLYPDKTLLVLISILYTNKACFFF